MAVYGLVAGRHCPQRRDLALLRPLPHRSSGSKPTRRGLEQVHAPLYAACRLTLIRPSPARGADDAVIWCYRPRYLDIQRLNYLWTIRHSPARTAGNLIT
jgi:hypothetical protein